MTGISREALRGHLQNAPLVQALRSKAKLEETHRDLIAAENVMERVGISGATLDEVRAKKLEYDAIIKNYSILIEDTWHITWQTESLIKKYLDYDIDQLSEYARF